MKRALITGAAGQDGSYLGDLLVSKGYEVFGLVRRGEDIRFINDELTIIWGDLTDAGSIQSAVRISAPDEVYNLGGVTDLKTAYAEPEMTWSVNYEAVETLLHAALAANPSVRFLQASSSETLLPSAAPLDERSPRDWQTENPYAKAKMLVDRDLIQKARERGVFACSAILFNHESPRRAERSALRKISRTLVRIRLGMATTLTIGNVELSRDWGFAGDYVQAMWKMLQQDVPEDFVIATGELHTVQDAIDMAAHCLDLELGTDNKIIVVDPELYKPAEKYPKVGDAGKAKKVLGWKPSMDFRSLIEMMVQEDLADLKTA